MSEDKDTVQFRILDYKLIGSDTVAFRLEDGAIVKIKVDLDRAGVAENFKNPDGTSQQVTEPLEDCLMRDKTPGIDLDYWLNNATSQGLPTQNIPDGDLWYWYPAIGTVAGFSVDSGGAVLYCVRFPQYSDSSLGVRRAKIKV